MLVLSGPSGVGKGYLGKYLSERYLCERLIATTTRPPRPGEKDGRDSRFISEEEFTIMQQSGKLFMCNTFFNARYGFDHEKLKEIYERESVPIVEIYTPTIHLFVQDFPDSYRVFLKPESLELLRQRMLERKQDSETLCYRLQKAEEEIDFYLREGKVYYQYSYTVTNENFDLLVSTIVADCSLRSRSSLSQGSSS